jgi:hypothetical protein
MITKQRKVGGSMVFTVPKEFANPVDNDTRYEVSKNDRGEIVYTPVRIVK